MFADPDTYSELNGLTGGVTGEMPGATTASAAVVNIPKNTDDSTEIELPTIDLDIEDTKTEEAAPAEETKPEEVKEETAPAEEAKTEESITALGEDDNKATVINEGSPDGKAIIVTDAQVTKLRASKETQKVLLNNKTNETPKSDEISPEKQLEEMMTQLPLLYEQGKTEEAAAMSEKISVLSKQLNPSA